MQGFRENGKEFAQQAFNDVVKKAAKKKAYSMTGVTGVADAGVAFRTRYNATSYRNRRTV